MNRIKMILGEYIDTETTQDLVDQCLRAADLLRAEGDTVEADAIITVIVAFQHGRIHPPSDSVSEPHNAQSS